MRQVPEEGGEVKLPQSLALGAGMAYHLTR